MRSLLLVTLLTSLTLAGCLGGGGQTASAMDLLEDAASVASGWTDAPALAGVVSIEPFQRYFEEGEGEIILHLDPTPGDGLAPGWVYLFDGGDRTVFVVMAAGLGVLAEGWMAEDEADEEFDAASTIEGWNVDSDEAAAIIADETDWPSPMENTTMLWSLFQTEDGPVWFVEREDPDADYYAAVHAGNGTLLENGTATFSYYGYTHSWGSGPMTPLSAPSAQVEAPEVATVTLDVNVAATVGSVRVTLEGPGGLLYDEVVDGSDHAAFDQVPAGEYALRFAGEPVAVGQVSYDLIAEWSG